MLTYKVVSAFIKRYWWVFVAVVGFILFEMWLGRGTGDLAKTLEEIQKRHQEELKAIKEADEARDRARKENEQRLQDRLSLIEQQYNAAQQQLDEKKRSELQRILKESQDDPEELAQKLSEVAGFKVILP